MKDVPGSAFMDDTGSVINVAGDNFYKACGALVAGEPGKGYTTCVKPQNHPNTDHEDYYGVVTTDAESKRAQLRADGESTGSSESST